MGAIALALLVILIGAGLFFWNRSLENQVQALEDERMSVIAQRDAQLETRVNTLSAALTAYQDLLRQHRNWSRIFNIIENRTVPEVTFSSFEGEYGAGALELEGTAQNYGQVARQVRAFEETEQFTRVTIQSVELNEQGQVAFSVSIIFKKDVVTGAPTIQ